MKREQEIWEEILKYWEKCDDPKAREIAITGIKTLKKTFPETDKTHPIVRNCWNLAPWNAENIGYMAEVISSFQGEKDFNFIRRRLSNKNSFEPIFIELEFKDMFKKKFPVIFDVELAEKKECDVVIKIFRRLVYCEITYLNDPKANLRNSRLFDDISYFTLYNNLDYRIKIENFGSQDKLEQIKKQLVKRRIEFSRIDFEKNFLLINGNTITIQSGKLDAILEGPEYRYIDEFENLERKISRKLKQLNSNAPNLLLVYTYHFSGRHSHHELTKDYIKDIEKRLLKYPDISALCLIYKIISFDNKIKKSKISGSYSLKSMFKVSLVSYYTDIIVNNNAKYPLNSQELINLNSLFKGSEQSG